jgi:hypothetical protein
MLFHLKKISSYITLFFFFKKTNYPFYSIFLRSLPNKQTLYKYNLVTWQAMMIVLKVLFLGNCVKIGSINQRRQKGEGTRVF